LLPFKSRDDFPQVPLPRIILHIPFIKIEGTAHTFGPIPLPTEMTLALAWEQSLIGIFFRQIRAHPSGWVQCLKLPGCSYEAGNSSLCVQYKVKPKPH
jgi:hypothetical protein